MKKVKAIEIERKYQKILSIDLGRSGAMAYWQNEKFVEEYHWERNNKIYMYNDIYRILEIIFDVHEKFGIDVIVNERVRLAGLYFQMALSCDIGRLCDVNKIKHVLYAPMSVKTVVGGRPSKEQIINYSSAYLGREIKSEHLADAIIIGLKYIRTGVPNVKSKSNSKRNKLIK